MTADWSLAATRGFSLFPLIQYSKRPAVRSWEPFMSAPASPALLAEWSGRPTLNMAVATGAISNCFVLDCDDLMARLEAESRGLPETFTVSTPRGTHFYFNHPGWAIGNHAGPSWVGIDGLDLRGDGGYVVGPGSYFIPTEAERAKGKVEGAYVIERDGPLADAPAWLLELTLPKGPIKPPASPKIAEETTSYGRAALHGEVTKLIECASGSVNDQINLTAFAIGQLVAGGEIVENEGWGAIEEALAARGLQYEEKAQGTVLRGWEAGLQAPRAVEHKEPLDPDQALGSRPMLGVPPPPSPDLMPAATPPIILTGDMARYFAGVSYVARRNEMFLPSGVMVKAASFDGIYGGPVFLLDMDGSNKTRSAFEAFRLANGAGLSKVWDVCFRPEMPPGQVVMLEGLPFLNTYVPIVTPRQAGDPAPFVNHVRKMLPEGDDADLLLHWMASAIQNPGRKFFWWPVVQGTKGNGKSLLLEVMTRAIGERYSHMVRADAVIKTGNQFNDWMVGKLFLGFGEIRSSEGKRDFVEIIKDTVTDKRIATEGKGMGQSTSDNRANGLMLTNWHDACPVDDDERRFGIFFTAQQRAEDITAHGMGGDYFPNLYRWLDGPGYAIVTHFLANMPLRAEMDPAQGLHRAPVTTSTPRAVRESLGIVEQELIEAIEIGQHGFGGGVATSTGLRSVLSALRRTVAPRRFPALMRSVGYVRHPVLEATNKGRANNALRDGSHPVLYFALGHEILDLTDATQIRLAAEMALFGEAIASDNVVPLRR